MTRAEVVTAASTLGALGLAFVAANSAPGMRVVPYLVAHTLLLVASLAACVWVSRDADPPRALRRVLLAGVALRLALIPLDPFTTTDVTRYLWDGAVARAGFDPYALPPLAGELAELRARVPVPGDHLDVATCYPPLALALFALAASFGARALVAWKALCALASIATAALVARASASRNAHALAPLAVLGPVAVFESMIGAHLDTFVALAALLMLDAALREKWDRAALAAGTVFALKIVPGVIALPVLVRAPRPVRFALLATLPFSVTFGAAAALGLTPPGSLPAVAENWSFGSPVWAALYARFPLHDEIIRPGLAVVGLLSIALISLRRKDIAANTVGAMGLSLAVSPVIYPWYGTSLAAALPLAPRRWAVFALAVLPTSYEVLDAYQSHGRWSPAWWPMGLLAASVMVGLSFDVWSSRRAR